MNFGNKLLGNPIVIAILIAMVVLFVTIIPTIYCKGAYKIQSYICSLLFMFVSITFLLVAYGSNVGRSSIVGSSEVTDFSNIFSTSTPFNQF